MDDQIINQLNRQIDEHHQCLCGRLDALARLVEALREGLMARLDAHEAYHRQCEHRWGLLKLAERYPFRLAALACTAGAGLLASAPESLRWLGRALEQLLRAALH